MKKLVLKMIIGVMLIALSACGKEPTSTPSDQLSNDNQSGAHSPPTNEAIQTAITTDGSAYSVLIQFFDHLHIGRYEKAASLYGGDYQLLIDQNPDTDPADYAALMRKACMYNGYQCLGVKIAGIERKPSPDEYVFGVQFQNEDRSVFVLGPCCGASETEQPPVSFFEIRVLKTADGKFRVLDMPPYMP